MTKIKCMFSAVILTAIVSCQQVTHSERTTAESVIETIKINEKHQFKIRGCAINYNGKDLYLAKDIQPWIDAFGDNYRLQHELYSIPAEVYIYDNIGITVAKLLRDNNEIVGLYFNTIQPKHATKFTYTDKLSDEKSELPLSYFEDAVDFEGTLLGSYPMTRELRSYLTVGSSVDYYKHANCTQEQKKEGGMPFWLRIGTTFKEPEFIDQIFLEKNILMKSEVEIVEEQKNSCLGKAYTTDTLFKSFIKAGQCSGYLNKDATLKPEFLAEYNERKRKGILHEDEIYTDYYNDDGTVNIKYIHESYINSDGTVDDSFTERNEYLSDSVE